MATLNLTNLNSTSSTSTNCSSTNLTSAGNIDLSGSWADAPAGTVIQMASASSGPAKQTFTSTTPVVITGLSVDFTPRRSDSKIIITSSLCSNITYVCSFGIFQDGSATVSTSGQTNSNEANMNITTFTGASTTNTSLLYTVSMSVTLDSGSTIQRTYDVRGTSGWGGAAYALSINNRSANDMAAFSTMIIYEVTQ